MTTAPQQQQQPHHQRPQHSPYQLQHQYHHEVPPPTPPSQHLQYGLHVQLDTATYDPDEVVPRGSPLMQPLRPRLEPSPSPPPEIPPGQIQPLSGDAVLVSYLDDGRRPEIAQTAGSQALPSADDDNDDFCNDNSDDNGNGNGNGKHDEPRSGSGPSGKASCRDTHGRTERNDTLTQTRNPMTATSTLQAVAVDALQAVAAEPSRHHVLLKSDSDISVSTRRLSIRDEQSLSLGHHPRELSLPRGHLKAAGARSPPVALPTPGELPPLQMDSPKSESNGGQSLSLPSIRSTLGDINRLPAEPRTHLDRDLSTRPGGPTQAFPRSPSTGIPRLPAVSAGNHVSPPISPNEAYPRGLPSPHSISTPSPFYYSANGLHQRQSLEYISNASGDTSRTDHTPSALATTVSVADRMSIDGLTNPQAGLYICNVSGCSAPPFQTQYLLNSHANVHSSARPHYCHVRGCPRSEGGKGFKRKNEMIRHGLVHDSPGYVCPFCADREHKYPRPDNLQRHVRVHHVDKDKDDPLLRDVLAQRPDGPNRGRRRRGAPP